MIFAVRHGERADRVPTPPPIELASDPQLTETGMTSPLSNSGIEQAHRTGVKISEILLSEFKEVPQIVIYSSPFLRCMQTAAGIRRELSKAFSE